MWRTQPWRAGKDSEDESHEKSVGWDMQIEIDDGMDRAGGKSGEGADR
jgi:hypothetical protein